MICELDQIVDRSLRQLAVDRHVLSWRAKERDWVNYFAHRHLIAECSHDGPLTDPAQIGIEVGVPQPPGYIKLGVSRDLAIWPTVGTLALMGIGFRANILLRFLNGRFIVPVIEIKKSNTRDHGYGRTANGSLPCWLTQ